MLETASERRQVKTIFWSHPWKNCFFFIFSHMDDVLRWTKCLALLEQNGAELHHGRKNKLMKVLSAWWKFWSSKCWNLFLSVDMLKPLFSSHLWKNCFFSKDPQKMNHWDEQNILLLQSKLEQKCTRTAKKYLMKVLSAWWNLGSSECWKLFLSLIRLKSIFWSHLWTKCFLLKYRPWLNHWDEQNILVS